MAKYNKAIVAILGGAATLLGTVWANAETVLNDEMITALGVLLTSIFVYGVPNADTEKK